MGLVAIRFPSLRPIRHIEAYSFAQDGKGRPFAFLRGEKDLGAGEFDKVLEKGQAGRGVEGACVVGEISQIHPNCKRVNGEEVEFPFLHTPGFRSGKNFPDAGKCLEELAFGAHS
jgi:hypothetical protein